MSDPPTPSRLPARSAIGLFLGVAVFSWPGVLERVVSLNWYIGDLRPLAYGASAASLLLGLACFAWRRSLDRAIARRLSRRRELVLAVVTVGVSSLATLGVVEATLRFLGMPYPREPVASEAALVQFDEELGWTYVPDWTTVRAFGSERREVTLHFDANGFRVRSESVRPDEGAPTLMLVGGSFTMGHGLPYEESFAGRLEAVPDLRLQVVNLGVHAYGTDQALLSLKRHYGRFDTKIVVYNFICDHVRRNAKIGRRSSGTKPRFALRGDGAPYLERRPLTKDGPGYSPLVAYVTMALNEYGPVHELDLTRALVDDMNRFVRSEGGRLILLHWGSDPNCGDLPFEGLGVEVVSTTPDAPPGWNDWVIPGDGHPDARAHAHVAGLLLEKLRG